MGNCEQETCWHSFPQRGGFYNVALCSSSLVLILFGFAVGCVVWSSACSYSPENFERSFWWRQHFDRHPVVLHFLDITCRRKKV